MKRPQTINHQGETLTVWTKRVHYRIKTCSGGIHRSTEIVCPTRAGLRRVERDLLLTPNLEPA
jgi:hypothetical protein